MSILLPSHGLTVITGYLPGCLPSFAGQKVKTNAQSSQVPGYLDEIKNPMDLGTMRAKVENMDYSSFDQFKADFMLIISNCLLFNATGSNIYKYAERLRESCRTIMNRYVTKICVWRSRENNSSGQKII